VASKTLVFQICHADAVPELLREFLNNDEMRSCSGARQSVMSRCWSTTESPFPGSVTSGGRSPTLNYPLCLYALANAYIGTNLSKNDPKVVAIRRDGWVDVPISFEQVKYAALDARLGFEIASKFFQLAGYNTHVDHLNVALLE
jgi:hypothetical protein